MIIVHHNTPNSPVEIAQSKAFVDFIAECLKLLLIINLSCLIHDFLQIGPTYLPNFFLFRQLSLINLKEG